jgi:hypothetical protein
LAGADFRTATDLAPADAKSAREQLLAHREDLIRWIDTVQARLVDLRGMLQRQDAKALEGLIENLTRERDRWLSGSLQDTGTPVDWEAAQTGVARLFLGSLADRKQKK